MLTTGDYTVSVTDLEGCETSFSFSITNEPGELFLDADIDNDGVDGLLQYNDFHVSCNGYYDGVIEFLIPSGSGVSPFPGCSCDRAREGRQAIRRNVFFMIPLFLLVSISVR